MFEHLKKFNNIIISGPQRSGTRIAAKAIAQDTNKTYIDEVNVSYHDFKLLEWHLLQGNVVVQCPGLCHLLHHIATESTLIIVVRRPIEEIIASERRCWNEKARKRELFKYGHSDGVISCIKYSFWDEVQKPILLEKAREVNYHSLKSHPLFIDKLHRKNFRWDQTQ